MEAALSVHPDVPSSACPERFVQRNRLVSALMQDRGVLRLIVAPHGFGKTALACEYATRMFVGKRVQWVDARTPDFLLALDAGTLPGLEASQAPDLLVLDALPWMHEQRAETLAHALDALLYRGIEVVVTALPSTDCLQALQPDRVLVRAGDLLVTEQECRAACDAKTREGAAQATRAWNQAQAAFMGRVPAVAWGQNGPLAAERCLAAFLDEHLPASLVRCALGMLLLGGGSVADIERLGAPLDAEDAGMIVREYPFLGMSANVLEFDMPRCPAPMLARVVDASGMAAQLDTGAVPLAQRAISLLLDRGDMGRAADVLQAFCSDERCADWLLARGWDLLDRAQFDLVERLFSRCPAHVLDGSGELLALRAWACGLQGDVLEARHFAQQALVRCPSCQPDGQTDAVGLLGYLALAAFDDGPNALYGKNVYAGQRGIEAPLDFLAAVVDTCTDAEVAAALSADGSERSLTPDAEREPVDAQRANALMLMFSQHHDRLWASLPYRVALHVLQHVASPRLRQLMRDIGCDIVVAARRNGLQRFSEALLVRDLWRDGYFGAAGSFGGKRDAQLLEDAARMLRTLAEGRAAAADIPWEAGPRPARAHTASAAGTGGGVELMNVSLFGSLEVVVGGRYIKEADVRRKSRTLLIMLAVNLGRDVSRDTLLEQLWPGLTRARALNNFYSAWSNIVAAIGEGPYLERTGDFCRVNARYVLTDVDEFERLSRQLLLAPDPSSADLLDLYARIESLYRGELVPSEKGCAAIDAQRVRYSAMFVDSMVSASACALSAHDARLALWFARKAMEVSDKREDVYFALMRAQMAAGQRCSAVRTYFECQQFLRDELGLDPSSETTELYDKLITTDPSLLRMAPDALAL